MNASVGNVTKTDKCGDFGGASSPGRLGALWDLSLFTPAICIIFWLYYYFRENIVDNEILVNIYLK